jgi:hypothetical protein
MLMIDLASVPLWLRKAKNLCMMLDSTHVRFGTPWVITWKVRSRGNYVEKLSLRTWSNPQFRRPPFSTWCARETTVTLTYVSSVLWNCQII